MSTAPPAESIFSQFAAVKKLLDGSSSGTPFATPAERTAHLAKTLAALTALDKAIEASDTFSPNEIIDDVSTASISYTQRGEHVKAARLLFKRFLDRCDSLLLVTEQAKRALSGKAPTDPVAARQEKIDAFRRETAAKKQMAALEAKLEERRTALAAAGANEVETALEADEDAVETARELRLLEVEGNINKAISHLRFIEQEEAILKHAETEEALNRERAAMGAGGGKYPGLKPPAHSKGAGVGGGDEASSLQREDTLSKGGHPGSGAYSSGQDAGPEAPSEAPRPLRVHKIGDRDDAKAPIPSHMQEYLKHVAPAPAKNAQGRGHGSVITGGGAGAVSGGGCAHQPSGCGHGHGHAHGPGGRCASYNAPDDGGDPYDKPWFRPSGQACDHCGDDDVTKRPQFTQYMLSKVVGGRGQLVPACPIHGNAHPAGQCPGLEGAGRGAAPSGFAADPISAMIRLRSDRAEVFRDRNPHLMELDDWVQMKQSEGALPGARDAALASARQQAEERRMQRIGDGEEDDEEQAKSPQQEREEEDAAQDKARAWADWTDDNEKGIGNRLYRR